MADILQKVSRWGGVRSDDRKSLWNSRGRKEIEEIAVSRSFYRI